MATIIKIGRGRDEHGKILDRNTTWFSVNNLEQWERCVHEWSLKKNSGKPLFISKNGRKYKEITGAELLKLKDNL
jgi:hypothetical protein